MKEYYYDKLFNIKTSKRHVISNEESIHYHPYEPTSYDTLELLFKHYDVRENDQFVDFGCGLGRFNFYTHYFHRVSITGIEGNEIYYKKALDNKYQYMRGTRRNADKLQFLNCLAEDYKIKETDNRFYFFNPFSIHVFRKVVQNILVSVEENRRIVDLILYYAHDDYVHFLENETLFELMLEVELPWLYERNPYERILVYRLDY